MYATVFHWHILIYKDARIYCAVEIPLRLDDLPSN